MAFDVAFHVAFHVLSRVSLPNRSPLSFRFGT
jgi:hypothetical protein